MKVEYAIGDIIVPRFERHKCWPNRRIVGYETGANDEYGYLWEYFELGEIDGEPKTYSTLNSFDPHLNVFWMKKT